MKKYVVENLVAKKVLSVENFGDESLFWGNYQESNYGITTAFSHRELSKLLTEDILYEAMDGYRVIEKEVYLKENKLKSKREKSGFKAFYIPDLRFIGDFVFSYDRETKEFVMESDPEIRYEAAVILQDSEWVFYEYLEDESGDVYEDRIRTVEPIEFLVNIVLNGDEEL